MELVLNRKKETDKSTIGELLINGVFECFTLEDKDRGLMQDEPLEQIEFKKVYGATAIPKGRYEVIISFSDRFQKYIPLLLNVPGFDGIRIHSGNTAADTLGCILLGQESGEDQIWNSRSAFNAFMPKLKAVEKKEKVFITIK